MILAIDLVNLLQLTFVVQEHLTWMNKNKYGKTAIWKLIRNYNVSSGIFFALTY